VYPSGTFTVSRGLTSLSELAADRPPQAINSTLAEKRIAMVIRFIIQIYFSFVDLSVNSGIDVPAVTE
jgi:hypothetical protein